MRRYFFVSKLVGVTFCVILLFGTIIVFAQKINQLNQAQSIPPVLPTVLRSPSPTRPSNCVPIPQESTRAQILTPTPHRGSSPIPNIRATVTPRVYANIFDLSPQLPRREKAEIVVFRCNGNFDLFLLSPEIDISQMIHLEAGDIIISSSPPTSLMGHQPPEASEWGTITPGATSPYLPPNTPTLKTTTPFSYPPPGTTIP